MPEVDIVQVQSTARNSLLFYCSFVSVIHGIGFGCSMGYAGLVLPFHAAGNNSFLQLDEEQGSWFVSVSQIAFPAGLLAGIPLAEMLGRRAVLVLSNLVPLVGYVVMFFADSFTTLLVGRIVNALGFGLQPVVFVWTSELCTVRYRGPMANINALSVNIGLFFSSAIVIVVPIKFLIFICGGINLLTLLLLPVTPETPHWYLMKNKREAAEKSLARLRGSSYAGISTEVEEIQSIINQQQSSSQANLMSSLMERTFLYPFAISITFFSLIAICGITTFMFYGPTIFRMIDVGIPPRIIVAIPGLGETIGYAGWSLIYNPIRH